MSIKVNSQFNYGTNTFKSDTIKFEKFREGQLVKSVGTYPNQQLKYIRYDLNSQIMDTVSYYSKDGKRIADVEYMNLTYVLYDSSYIDNYLFIDTCIHKVKTIIDSKFDKNQLPNNLFLNYSSSYQLNLQKKGFAFSTKLYEPVSHSIDDVVIIFSFKPKEDEYNYRTLMSFRIDSTKNIYQSNVDTNKTYDIIYDLSYAQDIQAQLKIKSEDKIVNNRGIEVSEPFLEFRQKKLKWVIKRNAYEIHIDKYDNKNRRYSDWIEEIEIDTETAEIIKSLKFYGISH